MFYYLYEDNKIMPLHMMLPKRSTYVKRSDGQTIYMYILLEDEGLFKKCVGIFYKISADIEK